METTLKRRGRRNQNIPEADLPNQVRTLRLAKGLTLSTLAEMIETDENSLSEFERQGTGLGRKKQWALSIALGVEYGDLLRPGKNFAEKVRQSLDLNTGTTV